MTGPQFSTTQFPLRSTPSLITGLKLALVEAGEHFLKREKNADFSTSTFPNAEHKKISTFFFFFF